MRPATRRRTMLRFAAGPLLTALIGALAGCQSASRTGDGAATTAKPRTIPKGAIRDIACMYDVKPWLNLDASGDLDPEGIQYRVFLDPGTGKGVVRDGTFHVEMYRIIPKQGGGYERELLSDWHYATGTFPTFKNKFLGMGYLVRLRWARKDVAGSEVELITRFADPAGHEVSAGTKRLRVPKYSS